MPDVILKRNLGGKNITFRGVLSNLLCNESRPFEIYDVIKTGGHDRGRGNRASGV